MNDLAKLLAISFDPDITHEYQRAPLYCASPRGARICASSGGRSKGRRHHKLRVGSVVH
jgi:hypothetical protein